MNPEQTEALCELLVPIQKKGKKIRMLTARRITSFVAPQALCCELSNGAFEERLAPSKEHLRHATILNGSRSDSQ
jgi:hypothetical protein